MYFRLKPEIYIMSGKKQDILCNVLSGEIITLDDKTAKVIKQAECNQIIEKNERIQRLIDMGWGMENNQEVYIDKIRYTNKYNKKRAWKLLPSLNTVIIQLTMKCTYPCKEIKCNMAYCPMCTTGLSNEELSFEEWKKAIDELDSFNPVNYIITGGNPLLYDEFNLVYNYLKSKGSNVFVHLNSIEDVAKLNADSLIYLSCFDEYTMRCAEGLNNVIIVSEFQSKSKNSIKINMDTPNISKASFQRKKTFAEIFTRMIYNDCLLGKVTIRCDGSFVPCLGMQNKVVGNIRNENLSSLMKKIYDQYWSLSIDDRENGKCNECAFRYNCTSCMKMEDHYCTYNVEEAIWK